MTEVLFRAAKVEISLGLTEQAIDDLLLALDKDDVSEEDRQKILCELGAVYYRQGQFRAAKRYFQMRREGGFPEIQVRAEPIEALTLLKLDQLKAVKAAADRLTDIQDKAFFEEIIATDEMIRTFQRNEYD